MGTATVSILSRPRAYQLNARRQRAMLAITDLVVLAAVAYVWHPSSTGLDYLGLGLLLVMRWQAGMFAAKIHLSALDEMPRAVMVAFVASGAYALVVALFGGQLAVSDVAWVTVCGFLLALVRAPVYVVMRWLRRNDLARERLLLVGGGVIADTITELAHDNPDYGLDLASTVTDLIDVDLVQQAKLVGASTVLVAFSQASEAREVFEIRKGLDAGLRILAVPRYFDLIGDGKADDMIFGMPVTRLGRRRPGVQLHLKRILDVVLSSMGLLVCAPFLLIVGPLLTRETGGALLFRQTRIGKHGRPFELLKLQTMKPVSESTSDVTWTVTDSSDRLGPMGKFLRKSSLDELPQLWNILRGDMSFVGPRPERPYFVEQFTEQYAHYEDRMRMTAGLTGLAQIYDLRGDTSIDDRARFDNRYADHWSLWSDLKIMLKTVPKVFKGSGG